MSAEACILTAAIGPGFLTLFAALAWDHFLAVTGR